MLNLNKVSPSQTKSPLGHAIETYAAEYLTQQGFELLHRNFSCRLGEIDLIGNHGDQLVFVEVRFKSNTQYGSPADSITYHKQRKIIRTARFFLGTRRQYANASCRFDFIAVTLKENSPVIEWIQNAFC